jgi:hypothetical protein
MVTYMVEHGLLLVPFMNQCKTRGMYTYVQLSNSPKTTNFESHNVWKLLYYTLYNHQCMCVSLNESNTLGCHDITMMSALWPNPSFSRDG